MRIWCLRPNRRTRSWVKIPRLSSTAVFQLAGFATWKRPVRPRSSNGNETVSFLVSTEKTGGTTFYEYIFLDLQLKTARPVDSDGISFWPPERKFNFYFYFFQIDRFWPTVPCISLASSIVVTSDRMKDSINARPPGRRLAPSSAVQLNCKSLHCQDLNWSRKMWPSVSEIRPVSTVWSW